MAGNEIILLPLQNANVSRNKQDSILGSGNSKTDVDEEPFETPDQLPQTVNLTEISSLSSPLTKRKRKGSDASEDDQDHRRASKKRCFEDGYPNSTNGRHLLFVFNYKTFNNRDNEERKGSESDVSSLLTTFSQLHYETVLYENLSYEETLDKLKFIQKLCNSGGTHIIVLAFMSHGDGRDPDSFVSSDGKSVSMNRVRDMFSNGNCGGLRGKPKIFLGIFCRNILVNPPTGVSTGVPNPSSLGSDEDVFDSDVEKTVQMIENLTSMIETDGRNCSDSPGVCKPNDLEDMITFYSTLPGTVSNRHNRNGSIMVQCLSEVIAEYGETCHLNDLYYYLQERMKTRPTGASWEYKFHPDKVEFMMKTCFLTNP